MNIGSCQTQQVEAPNELLTWHFIAIKIVYTRHINVFCVKMVELCSLSLLDITQRKAH